MRRRSHVASERLAVADFFCRFASGSPLSPSSGSSLLETGSPPVFSRYHIRFATFSAEIFEIRQSMSAALRPHLMFARCSAVVTWSGPRNAAFSTFSIRASGLPSLFQKTKQLTSSP